MLEIELEENGSRMVTEFGELAISPDEKYGFRPFQLMVASLSGCSLASFKVVLKKMRIDFSDINVSVNVERNEEKANRIEKIHMNFSVKGENLSKEKVEKAGNVARKHCSMVQSVGDSIQITEAYHVSKN